MPEWLLKKDDYIPLKEKDAFINKSILSILGVLTRFRLHTEYKSNKFEINAAIKIMTTLLFILFISLSRSLAFITIMGVFLLMMVSFLEVPNIKKVFKMSIVTAVFSCIILLPSILMGNRINSLVIVFKILLSVAAVNITSCTTRWEAATSALKLLFIPDIFIFVFDITMKYIVIFGEFSLNMLYSLKLRSVGKNNSKVTSLSGIIGTMFLKSKEMAEEMHGSMECRGFTGEYKVNMKIKLSSRDILCIIINVLFVSAYFYFDRL